MYFILQKSVFDRIQADVKTSKGKASISMQLKYYYILHRLNHTRVFKKEEYSNGVPMNAKVLTALFGKGSIVKEVLDYLEKNNFITKTKHYRVGRFSSKYVLHEKILDERVFQIVFDVTDSTLIRKLENRNLDLKNSFDGQLNLLVESVKLNDFGKSFLIKKYGCLPLKNSFVPIEASDFGLIGILNGDFFSVRPDLKSRVYTNLTSLSREHRKYVQINGEPMLMTDISNSQILLTVPLLLQYWHVNYSCQMLNLPNDVNDFKRLAETGKFYEEMSRCVGLELENDNKRSSFKKKIFKEIWFSKNSKRITSIKKAFKTRFPTVFNIIWELKKERYNDFAIELQRFEASILVDKVWMEMHRQNKTVFTLHDAIICSNKSDLILAESLIKNELMKFGIKPKLKQDDVATLLAA